MGRPPTHLSLQLAGHHVGHSVGNWWVSNRQKCPTDTGVECAPIEQCRQTDPSAGALMTVDDRECLGRHTLSVHSNTRNAPQRAYDHPFLGFFFDFFLQPTVRIESEPVKLWPAKVSPLSDAVVSPQRIPVAFLPKNKSMSR